MQKESSELELNVFRRGWMRFAVFLALLVGAEALPAQPNVLFIAVDDLNDWVEPYGGHPAAQTPAIQALANDGIVFSRAYCPATECNPSRAAVMNGVSPATSGVHCNTDPMEGNPVLDFVTTMPEWFADSTAPSNGYYTISRGKVFHFSNMSVPYFDEWSPDPQCGEPAGTFPYNGYPESYASATSPRGVPIDWAPTTGPPEQTSDYKTALWAKDLLEGNHATNFDDKPFFMAVGIFRPHIPFYVPQEYFDLYDPDTVSMPITDPGRPASPADLADILAPTGLPKYSPGVDFQWATDNTAPPLGTSANPADNAWGELIAAYLASVSYADACIGEILDGLNNGPYRDNTIVVLWSDHGWLLGEKSHLHKRMLWERTTRVPLIIKMPGNDPQRRVGRCDRVVNLLDLYPTLTEYCGLPSGINPDNDGRSFAPLLRDPAQPWPYPTMTSIGFGGRADHAVRDERWRYVRCYDGTEELYDHNVDPNEYQNLANLGVPAYENEMERLRRHLPEFKKPHDAWRLPYRNNTRSTMALWHMDQSELGQAPNQLRLLGPPAEGPFISPGGRFGTALESVGSAGRNRAEVVSSRGLFPLGLFPELTVEAWVKFNPGAFNLGPLRQQYIVHKTERFLSTDGGYLLAFNDWNPGDQALVWEVADGVQNIRAQTIVTGRLIEGQWHHIAGTWGLDPRYNEYRASLYLDGWEIASELAPLSQRIVNDPAVPVTIGNHAVWNNVTLDGLVDEVRISDVAYDFSPLQRGELIWAQAPIVKPPVLPGGSYSQNLTLGVDVIDLDGDPITFSKRSFDSGPNHPAGDWLTIGVGGALSGAAPTETGTYRWTVRAEAGTESVDTTLEISVGEGQLIGASCMFRNGSGINPADFVCTTDPVLGAIWRSRIATNPDTVAAVLLVGPGGPRSGVRVFGGERLIRAFPAPLFVISADGNFSVPIATGGMSVGLQFWSQGLRIDQIGGTPTPVWLNAQDLVLGY